MILVWLNLERINLKSVYSVIWKKIEFNVKIKSISKVIGIKYLVKDLIELYKWIKFDLLLIFVVL